MKWKPQRRILTPKEKVQVKEKIKDLRIQLEAPELAHGPNGYNWRESPLVELSDPRRQRAELRRMEKTLEDGSPEDLDKYRRGENDKEIKRLEGEIKKHLTPTKFYHQKKGDTKDFHKVVDHLVKQETDPKFVNMATEYADRCRQRDPDDPNAGDISRLRE